MLIEDSLWEQRLKSYRWRIVVFFFLQNVLIKRQRIIPWSQRQHCISIHTPAHVMSRNVVCGNGLNQAHWAQGAKVGLLTSLKIINVFTLFLQWTPRVNKCLHSSGNNSHNRLGSLIWIGVRVMYEGNKASSRWRRFKWWQFWSHYETEQF